MEIINFDFDIKTLKDEYSNTGQVVIRNFLNSNVAEDIYHCMESYIPWEFVFKKAGAEPAIVKYDEMQRVDPKKKT